MTADAEQFDGVSTPFKITLKAAAGYEAPWINIEADNALDAIDRLAEAVEADLPAKVAEYARDFQEKYAGAGSQSAPAQSDRRSTGSPSRSGGSRGGSQGAGSRRESAPAQNDDIEYHPEGLTCEAPNCNGAVQYKKISKGSRTFELWVCPNQRSRNDGHFSEFIN